MKMNKRDKWVKVERRKIEKILLTNGQSIEVKRLRNLNKYLEEQYDLFIKGVIDV